MSPEVLAELPLPQSCEYFDKSEDTLPRLDKVTMIDLISYEDGRPINEPRTLHDFCMGTLQKNCFSCKGYLLTSIAYVKLTSKILTAIIGF